jgi:hypothetical protein
VGDAHPFFLGIVMAYDRIRNRSAFGSVFDGIREKIEENLVAAKLIR